MHKQGISSALDAHVNRAWGPFVIRVCVYLQEIRIRGVEDGEKSKLEQATPGCRDHGPTLDLTGTRSLIIHLHRKNR